MNKFSVARVEDIPPGSREIIHINGRQIGVFNIAGKFVALQNICPHQGAPVCLGDVEGTNSPSEPNEFNWQRAGEILRCPWHGWEFDLFTGQSLFDSQVKVKTYKVEIVNDQVVVEL